MHSYLCIILVNSHFTDHPLHTLSTAHVWYLSADSDVRYERRHSARQPHRGDLVAFSCPPSWSCSCSSRTHSVSGPCLLSFRFRNLRSLVISIPQLHLLCCIPGHWTRWLRPSTHLPGTPCSISSAQMRLWPATAFQTLASK